MRNGIVGDAARVAAAVGAVGLKSVPMVALAACPLWLGGCEGETGTSGSETSAEEATEGSGSMSAMLQTQIDEYKAGFAQKADDDLKRVFQEGIDDVLAQGVLDSAVGVGDTAPVFTLPNATGSPVALADLLADGPVVLVWYRGGWCPYCNLTLRAYQDHLGRIRELGATLVAISPERPDHALSTQEKNELEFEVLTDESNRVAKDYGVVFGLTDEVHFFYNERFGFDDHNGQDSGELPLSATYVIEPGGTVSYAILHHDYRERAEPSEVIAALERAVQ